MRIVRRLAYSALISCFVFFVIVNLANLKGPCESNASSQFDLEVIGNVIFPKDNTMARCNGSEKFLSVQEGGRLGNLMSEYAALHAISQTYPNHKPIIGKVRSENQSQNSPRAFCSCHKSNFLQHMCKNREI